MHEGSTLRELGALDSQPFAAFLGVSLFETDVEKRKAELVRLYILCATAAAHGFSSHSLTVQGSDDSRSKHCLGTRRRTCSPVTGGYSRPEDEAFRLQLEA